MIRIAILGAGLIGPRHAQSVQSNPHTTLCAFIDPSPSAQSIADSFSVPLFPSIHSLLATLPKESHPHAAIICTPNHTHVPLAKELLAAGITNILLEKPIAETLASAQDLLDTIKSHQSTSSTPSHGHGHGHGQAIKILVGHHRRFNTYTLALKSLLSDPKQPLGTILAISGTWTLQKPSSYFQPPNDWRASHSSGGVLAINLIHDIDLLHFLLGPIVRVYAEPTRAQRALLSNPAHTAEEGAALTLRFASGVVGTFLVCDNAPAPWSFEAGTGENPAIPRVPGVDCYRIFGTGGSVGFPGMRRWSYDGVDEGEGGKEKEKGWNEELSVDRVEVDGEGVRPFDRQLEHFVAVLRGDGVEVACGVEDGVRALRVVRAVKESLETGVPVDVDVEV